MSGKVSICCKVFQDNIMSLCSVDEGLRQEILESCKKQVEAIMDCTPEPLESINNDVKEDISDNFRKLSESVKIDQIDEDDEEKEPCDVFDGFWQMK